MHAVADACVVNVSAGHDVHAPAPPRENVPAPHGVHPPLPAVENMPAPHVLHPLLPPRENLPAGHCVHWLVPSAELYHPVAHGAHDDRPAAENEPGRHRPHDTELGGAKVPAAQTEQLVRVPSGEKVPPPHATQPVSAVTVHCVCVTEPGLHGVHAVQVPTFTVVENV